MAAVSTAIMAIPTDRNSLWQSEDIAAGESTPGRTAVLPLLSNPPQAVVIPRLGVFGLGWIGEFGGLHGGSLGEGLVEAGEPRPALAPRPIGKAEVKIAER